MDQREVFDLLDGFFAYETGCVDSGIRDDARRSKLMQYLDGLTEDEDRRLISTFVRDRCVSPEAVEAGYGWEDAKHFLEWYEDRNHYYG